MSPKTEKQTKKGKRRKNLGCKNAKRNIVRRGAKPLDFVPTV